MVQRAMAAHAAALVVYSSEGFPAIDMNCEGAQCDDQSVGLPASMVSYPDGLLLEAAIAAASAAETNASVRFATAVTRGTNFGINADGELVQTWGGSGAGAGTTDGNPGDGSCMLYPRMSFLAWAGRFEVYKHKLSTSIAAWPASTQSVALFTNESIRPASGDCYASLPWGCGPSAVAEVPRVSAGQEMMLDLALGCHGDTDVSCPQWDHIVQLRTCCVPSALASDGADASSSSASSLATSAVSMKASSSAVSSASAAVCDAQLGPEIGRWMTSFGRRVGHWLTNVTALAPLLSGRQCNFSIYTAPWEGNQGAIPWVATLALVVAPSTPPPSPPPPSTPPPVVPSPPPPPSAAAPRWSEWLLGRAAGSTGDAGHARAGAAQAAGASRVQQVVVHHPWALVTTETGGIASIFRWVAFNQSYDTFWVPYAFHVPNGSRVQLLAVISGHGNDNHGCGEFCATEHRFSVNGQPPHVKRQLLPVTDQELGCAEEVDSGVTPNEYGTWLYGRDGWCNGREVPATKPLCKLAPLSPRPFASWRPQPSANPPPPPVFTRR